MSIDKKGFRYQITILMINYAIICPVSSYIYNSKHIILQRIVPCFALGALIAPPPYYFSLKNASFIFLASAGMGGEGLLTLRGPILTPFLFLWGKPSPYFKNLNSGGGSWVLQEHDKGLCKLQ